MQLLRLCAIVVMLAAAMPAAAMSQPQPPKEFVPVDDIPQGEQIPAINLSPRRMASCGSWCSATCGRSGGA